MFQNFLNGLAFIYKYNQNVDIVLEKQILSNVCNCFNITIEDHDNGPIDVSSFKRSFHTRRQCIFCSFFLPQSHLFLPILIEELPNFIVIGHLQRGERKFLDSRRVKVKSFSLEVLNEKRNFLLCNVKATVIGRSKLLCEDYQGSNPRVFFKGTTERERIQDVIPDFIVIHLR